MYITTVYLEILTNLTVTIRQEHCGNLLGTEKPLLPTASSSHKSFSRVNHYPFFQKPQRSQCIVQTCTHPDLHIILLSYPGFPFYHFYNHLPSENFWNFLLSDLLNFTSKSSSPPPAQSHFIPVWTHLNLTAPVSRERVWKVCLIAAFFVIWLRGRKKKKIHIALECLWNGSEWKGLTERNPTEWTRHKASWLEKLPTGFLFPSSKMRNSDQLGGLRFFPFFFKKKSDKLINIHKLM